MTKTFLTCFFVSLAIGFALIAIAKTSQRDSSDEPEPESPASEHYINA